MGKREQYGPAAEKLYIEAGRTIDEIADLLPVSRKTIGDWCKAGNWVLKRKKRKVSPAAIVERIEEAKQELLDGEHIDHKTADALAKLDKTLQNYLKVSEEHFLTKAIEVMDRFVERLMHKYKDPEERRAFTDEIDEFFHDLEDQQ